MTLRFTQVSLHSLDHGQLWTSKLVLEEPVAEVDGQVDAVYSINWVDWAVVLHVHRHKLVADLGCVLCSIGKTELDCFHFMSNIRVLWKINLIRLYTFGPPDMIQALSEEYDESQNHFVEARIGFLWNLVQIQSESFIDQHLVSSRLIQIKVWIKVMAPATLLPVKTVGLKFWRVIRHDLLLLTLFILSVCDVSLVLGIILLLVLRFVSATKL